MTGKDEASEKGWIHGKARSAACGVLAVMLMVVPFALLALNASASNDLYVNGLPVAPPSAAQSQRDVPMMCLMLNTTGPAPVNMFGIFLNYWGMDSSDVEKVVCVHDTDLSMTNSTGDVVLDVIYAPMFPALVNAFSFIPPFFTDSILLTVDISPTATVGNFVQISVNAQVDIMADQPVSGFFPLVSNPMMINPNNAPLVSISSPVGGERILLGEPLDVAGTATDAEDGPMAGEWWSSLDGHLGTGNAASLALTTEGQHTITFNATDRCGAQSSATVDVYYTRAVFNGSWRDCGVDSNGDGMFDILRVEAGVEAKASARVFVQGELRDAMGWTTLTLVPLGFPPEDFFLPEGEHWVAFDFWGFDIYDAQANFGVLGGPYSCWNVRITDASTWVVCDEKLAPYNTTAPYAWDDFQRPPEFTGNFSHATTDADGDGKYDSLVMRAKVNATLPGYHSWQGQLTTEGGAYIADYWSPFGGEFLPIGESMAEFSFDGKVIRDYCENNAYSGNFSLSNIPLYEWITTDMMQTLRDEILGIVYTSSNVSGLDFEPPPFFTGAYSDYGIDANGDSLFDWLCIEVEVNVSEAGDYEFFGQLLVSGTPTLVDSTYNTTTLTAGVHTVTMRFSGYDIYKTGMTGISFNLNNTRIMTLWDYVTYDNTPHAYETGVYDFSMFQPPPFFIVKDSFFDEGYDEDGNGYFDCLNVTFQVSVSAEGDYRVHVASLRTSANTAMEYGVEDIFHFLPGANLAILHFDGMRINELGNVGMYRLYDVRLYDQYGEERDPGVGAPNYYWWTNAAYDNTLFQPGSFFTGSYSSHGKDMDGDAKYDFLCADIGLNVTRTGTWTVSAQLWSGTAYIATAYEDAYLTEGLVTYQLDFPGFDVFNFGQDSPYFLRSAYITRQSDYLTTDQVAGPVVITDPPFYNYTDFDAPSRFTGTFSHNEVDGDGDGLFELLTILIEVEILAGGDFSVTGNLEDSLGVAIVWNLLWEGALSPGLHWVALEIPGYAIWDTGRNQTYTLAELYLREGATVHDYLDPAYTLPGTLDSTDYVPLPYLTEEFDSYGKDIGGDWHYEYLTVALRFNATAPGRYSFNVQMQNDDGMFYNAWKEVDLVAGLQWVEMDFAGGPLFDSGYNGTYSVLWINANDLFGIYWENLPGTNHVTGWYNHTDFAPPSFYTGSFADWGEDLNADGEYENLVIDAEVDLAYAGFFRFEGMLETYPGGVYAGWATVEGFFPAGVQTVELRWPGYGLYALEYSGRYRVDWLQMTDEWWNNIDMYDEGYITASYGHGEWEQAPATGFPDSPLDLIISVSGTDLVLDWENADPDIDRYNIYRSGSPTGFNFAAPYAVTTSTHWVDPGVDEGADANRYYYVVRSVDAYGIEEENYLRVGKVPLSLPAGWSMASLPLSQQGGLSQSLATIAGQYGAVQSYESGTGEWLVHAPGAPSWVDSLSSLEDGQAFWIDASSACTVMALGEVEDSSEISLHKGWNMVGYPSLNATRTVNDVLAGLPWDAVQTSGAGPYNLVDLAGTDAVTPGMGMWVHVTSDCTLSVDL